MRTVILLLVVALASCGAAHHVVGLVGTATLAGVNDSSGIDVTVVNPPEINPDTKSRVTAADGSYAFDVMGGEVGEPLLYTVTAHAPSTLERDISVQVVIEPRPTGDTSAPPIVFTAVGRITGTVTIAGNATGNGGIVVGPEGMGATSTTDDAGHFTIEDVPVGSYTLHAALAGHTPVTAPATVTYNATATVAPMVMP